MSKKKQIYCRCGGTASWYKKGKNHRVLVCSSCGIIANNPIPLLMAAASYLAPKIIEKVSEKVSEKKPTQRDATPVIFTDSKDKPNYAERVINQVMKQEGI